MAIERLSEQVNVALSQEFKSHLDRYAQEDRRRPGELARLIVEDWIRAKVEEEGLPPIPVEKPRPISTYGRAAVVQQPQGRPPAIPTGASALAQGSGRMG